MTNDPDRQFGFALDRDAVEPRGLLRGLLELDPVSDLLEYAWTLFYLGQFEAALQATERAFHNAEISKLRAACYRCLARWTLEVGDLRKAEVTAQNYLREVGNSFDTLALCGEVASMRGDDASALNYFNSALTASDAEVATAERVKDVTLTLYLRVASLVRLRRFDEALQHWSSVERRDSNNADLWYLGALCLVQRGRQAEALTHCRRALEIDEHHIDAGKLKQRLETV